MSASCIAKCFAADADASHFQFFGGWVVEANTGEIDGQAVFQASHLNLENAFQILPFADGPRDLIEQA